MAQKIGYNLWTAPIVNPLSYLYLKNSCLATGIIRVALYLMSNSCFQDSHLYSYSGLYVYCFGLNIPPVYLLPPVSLFRTLEYS